MNGKLSVVSAFSGCGGSSLGFHLAGYDERLAIECDRNAVATFRENFPDVTVFDRDIRHLSVAQALEMANLKPGELDVLQGSPPCQGFSSLGKNNLHDERNNLWWEFDRLLDGLRPKAFVMENVKGMVRGKMKRVYLEAIAQFRSRGYRAKGAILDAQYFGVPQRRERTIIIGFREDLGIDPSHPTPLPTKPPTVRDAIFGLPDRWDVALNHVWVDERDKKNLIRKIRSVAPGERVPGRQRIRLEWDKVAPTLTKGGVQGRCYINNTELHPQYHRALSVRELARLSSFPDTFRFVDAYNDGKARIGNCVPPLMMRAIAKHIRQNLDLLARW